LISTISYLTFSGHQFFFDSLTSFFTLLDAACNVLASKTSEWILDTFQIHLRNDHEHYLQLTHGAVGHLYAKHPVAR
jgi:hypothetical protein|tara:strand:- start:623 stop:853 length:231 start_codon:yes stop_codon:yes gene_type:complete